jgi:hypothetical protein
VSIAHRQRFVDEDIRCSAIIDRSGVLHSAAEASPSSGWPAIGMPAGTAAIRHCECELIAAIARDVGQWLASTPRK